MLNRPKWTNHNVMGYIPAFLNLDDPRPAKEQIDDNYQHGGGWFETSSKYELIDWKKDGKCILHFTTYHERNRELSRCKIRDETLIFFEGSWLAIVQPDGKTNMARVD